MRIKSSKSTLSNNCVCMWVRIHVQIVFINMGVGVLVYFVFEDCLLVVVHWFLRNAANFIETVMFTKGCIDGFVHMCVV